jgi:hypothetical protein
MQQLLLCYRQQGAAGIRHSKTTMITTVQKYSHFLTQRAKLKLLSRFAMNLDDGAILKRLGSSQGQLD